MCETTASDDLLKKHLENISYEDMIKMLEEVAKPRIFKFGDKEIDLDKVGLFIFHKDDAEQVIPLCDFECNNYYMSGIRVVFAEFSGRGSAYIIDKEIKGMEGRR